MIIEFSGLPGSGKSAIIKSLRRKFRKSGIPLVPAQKTGGQSSTVKEVMNNPWVNNWAASKGPSGITVPFSLAPIVTG